MSRGIKEQLKESGGLLRNLFKRSGHETPAPDEHSGPSANTKLDLADIQGFILRGYRMPMVPHFLLTVGVPAEARKLLGRLVNGDESDAPQITTAEDWHVGFEPGPGDNLADIPRRKPDYCLNIGITWPGLIALELKDRVPTLSFKSFGAFTAGAAERAKLVGDTGAGAPQNWVGGLLWHRERSRSRDPTRHQPGNHGKLQRPVNYSFSPTRCFSRDLATRRYGADGNAGW